MPATTSLPAVGQRLQQRPRALVRAVLAPHDAEHRELEAVRVAPQLLADRVQLDVVEAERAVERDLRGHGDVRLGGGGHRGTAPASVRVVPADGAGRGVLLGAHDERADDPEPVRGPDQRLDGRLGMGHEPGDVARGVGDARDPAQRPVGVAGVVRAGGGAVRGGVAPQDLAVALERVERGVVGEVAALAVRDRHPERAPLADLAGERRVEPLGDERDLAAHEPQPAVAQQGARHEPRLGEHLEPVADAQHRAAAGREVRDRTHHRAEPGDDARPEVVAVREPAGQEHARDVGQVRVLVPQHHRLRAGHRQAVDRVDVAVGAREQDDPDADAHPAAPAPAGAGASVSASASTVYCSMSGFDSSSPGQALDDRAGGVRVGRGHRQLDAAAHADTGHAGDAEVGQAALDGLALRVEDAGLGGDVDRIAVRAGRVAHRAITSSSR